MAVLVAHAFHEPNTLDELRNKHGHVFDPPVARDVRLAAALRHIRAHQHMKPMEPH